MDIISFLIVGLLAGWLASVLVRGRGFGVAGDIVIGVVGAFIGGMIFKYSAGVDAGDTYGFWGSLLVAVIGAVVLLVIAKMFNRETRM